MIKEKLLDGAQGKFVEIKIYVCERKPQNF
jgi:hypothetical protein